MPCSRSQDWRSSSRKNSLVSLYVISFREMFWWLTLGSQSHAVVTHWCNWQTDGLSCAVTMRREAVFSHALVMGAWTNEWMKCEVAWGYKKDFQAVVFFFAASTASCWRPRFARGEGRQRRSRTTRTGRVQRDVSYDGTEQSSYRLEG